MSMIAKPRRNTRDESLIELFRLRYRLREAAETGRRGPEIERSLERLRQLARTRGDLLFEYRRWVVTLQQPTKEAA
jgi:hypothetical protein